MPQESTPRQRITAAATRDGEKKLVGRCVAILEDGQMDAVLLDILGGAGADRVFRGDWGGHDGQWPRTWALRALLYVWDPSAQDAVVDACDNEHWRVREMAAKVIARRRLTGGDTEAALDELTADENHRVRAAAQRALRG